MMVEPKQRAGYAIAGDRAAGQCEICGVLARRSHRHHRRPRGMGGSTADDTNEAQNILWLCPHCHLTLVELNRKRALDEGWLVPQGRDPSTVPVHLFDGWFYLAPDGGKVPLIELNRAASRGRSGPGVWC